MPTTNQETAIDVDNDRDDDLDTTIGNDADGDAVEHDTIDDVVDETIDENEPADDEARDSLKNLMGFVTLLKAQYKALMADEHRSLTRPPRDYRFAEGDALIAAVAHYTAQDGQLGRGEWLYYELLERRAARLINQHIDTDRKFWSRGVDFSPALIEQVELLLEAIEWFGTDGPERGEVEEVHLESIEQMDSYATAVSDAQIAKMFAWTTPEGSPDVRRVRIARKEKTPPPVVHRKTKAAPWPERQPTTFSLRETVAYMTDSGYHRARKEYLGY